ncbi:MAG: prolipoprotein diacylglyceryl transferase [Phycisphaera sp.]|nr:prolipoprotein diacylglyceryl transferase [Phycisphaera sp.]
MIATLAVYIHDIDPFVFRFPDVGFLPEGIRWYGLSYLVGFILAYLLIRRVTRVGRSSLAPEKVADFVVTIAIGTVIGGRLGYVLFYEPSLAYTWLDGPPYWGVLAINHGGMASHGGIIGMVLGALFFARRYKHPWGHLLDLIAFAAGPGIFCGRIANFINGELVGRALPAGSRPWWGIFYPQELYELPEKSQLDIVSALPGRLIKPVTESDVLVDTVYAARHHDGEVLRILEQYIPVRYPSQLIAAGVEGLLLFIVLAWLWRKPRKPFLITGAGVITYAIARISDEFFRRPDVQIANQEFAHFGVTRGQLLSAVMLLVGAAVILFARHRKADPMGGWLNSNKV